MLEKPNLVALQAALQACPAVHDLCETDEWGRSIVGRFASPSTGSTLTFLVRPANGGGLLDLVVPNLWNAPVDETPWAMHAALVRVAEVMFSKLVLTQEGDLHLALGVPAAAGLTLAEIVQRAVTVLRRDVDTLRAALAMTMSE